MRGTLVAAVLSVLLAFNVGTAAADVIGPQDPNKPEPDSPWQAGTCKDDGPPVCSVATPGKFYERAAGHPPVGFTQFIVNGEPGTVIPPLGAPVPNESLRTVRVDLPPGLTVNPQATPQCALPPGESPTECALIAPDSQVGVSEVTAVAVTPPLDGTKVELSAPVYNLVPLEGEPARFGLSLANSDVFLEADIEWEGDYHEYFKIDVHKIEVPVAGEVGRVLKNRLVFDGTSGDGTFITTPTTCFGPAHPPGGVFEHIYSTYLRADSFEQPNPNFPNGSNFVESKIPPGTSPKECESIPFDPSIAVEPNTDRTNSPSGATVTVNLPEIKGATNQSTSQVRSARVSLPEGMGLNPSAANGLQACTNEQFGKGTRNPIACPAGSRIGTVEVDTPPLPDGSLSGPVFVGQQLSNDPASGDLYRIFLAPESARYDISARLVGKVSANPQTGQLTTSIEEAALGSVPIPGLPQVPFESFRFNFNGGPKAPLTSPPTCGPNTTTSQMTPWSSAVGQAPPGGDEGPSTDPPATPAGAFSLASLPGGGACPKTLGERPFSLGFGARSDSKRAGAFSPLNMDITRGDGNQELKGVEVKLPPGITAKLAGVRYCPEAAIAAASASSGAAEMASSSCPNSSLIGVADISSGTGSEPLRLAGKVFLAGPYKGAPLSLAVVTPATAGPFDVGTVVVRVALFVDRTTAQVNAISDPIPHVYGGALLDIRSIAVRLNRKNFSLNPTNCSPMSFAATLRGGGSDPLNPAAFSSAPASAPYQVNNCDKLGFKPKLFLRLFGAMKRAKNPKLRAVYLTRKGDANTARAAVTLPRSLFLDQSNLAKVCTRPQYEARNCPRKSMYGHASAFTPLLDKKLTGPVYLRSSDNDLPDLVAALRGQVDVDLVGRIDSVKGRIRTTFDTVPDVPVSKFVLIMRGGKKGLLTNSRNQCAGKRKGKKGKAKRSVAELSRKKGKKGKRGKRKLTRAVARIKGQNGKKANQRPKLRKACGKGKAKGKRGARR